jgi:hypothetical protein
MKNIFRFIKNYHSIIFDFLFMIFGFVLLYTEYKIAGVLFMVIGWNSMQGKQIQELRKELSILKRQIIIKKQLEE